jgi:F0F1-type ATP synthase alpha subunit
MERAGNFRISAGSAKSAKSAMSATSVEPELSVKNKSDTAGSADIAESPTYREVSISCLPVVETVESDLTGYISTNIMSMTDGHIFFDQGTFAQGRRPAVNIPLSVTRVGRQAQSSLKRDINQKLTSFLSSFDQMQNLSHFGAELSGKVQNTLKTGEKLFSLFKQANHETLGEEAQLILFALIWSNILGEQDISKARETMGKISKDKKNVAYFKTVVTADTLDQLLVQVNQHKDELLGMLDINATTQPEQGAAPSQQAQPEQAPQQLQQTNKTEENLKSEISNGKTTT